VKKVLIALLAIIISLGCITYQAEAIETSGSASLDIYSSYMWRGFELHEDVAIQPSVGITYGGFGANLWSDINADTGEITETDVTVTYAFSKDMFGFDIGYIFYGLEGIDETQELYIAVSYDTLLSPSLTLYYDFDEGDGAFIVASVGHDIAVNQDIAVSLGASMSYNAESEYAIGDYSALHNGEISVSTSIPVYEAISISPMLAYSFSLSDDAEEALENADGDSNFFYGGASVSLSF
jgi:hypothetical protein